MTEQTAQATTKTVGIEQFYKDRHKGAASQIAQGLMASTKVGDIVTISLNNLQKVNGGTRRTWKVALDNLIADGIVKCLNPDVIGAAFEYEILALEKTVEVAVPKVAAPKAEKNGTEENPKKAKPKKGKSGGVAANAGDEQGELPDGVDPLWENPDAAEIAAQEALAAEQAAREEAEFNQSTETDEDGFQEI